MLHFPCTRRVARVGMEELLKAGDYDALATLCEEEELTVNGERKKEWGEKVLEWPLSSCVHTYVV